MIGIFRITRAAIAALRSRPRKPSGGIVRLSTITGQPPARNFTHIDSQGRLRRCEGMPHQGLRALPPGGCAARLCAGQSYACELCGTAWTPVPDMFPPCATPRAAYEQYLRDKGAA